MHSLPVNNTHGKDQLQCLYYRSVSEIRKIVFYCFFSNLNWPEFVYTVNSLIIALRLIFLITRHINTLNKNKTLQLPEVVSSSHLPGFPENLHSYTVTGKILTFYVKNTHMLFLKNPFQVFNVNLCTLRLQQTAGVNITTIACVHFDRQMWGLEPASTRTRNTKLSSIIGSTLSSAVPRNEDDVFQWSNMSWGDSRAWFLICRSCYRVGWRCQMEGDVEMLRHLPLLSPLPFLRLVK